MDAISSPPPHSIFHHGIRERGGTIYWAALPSERRQVQADIRSHLIHRPARDIIPPLRWSSRVLLLGLILCGSSCCCSLLPGPAEVAALGPHPVQDDREPAGGGDDRPLHAPPLGELQTPGLQPRAPGSRASAAPGPPRTAARRSIPSPHLEIRPVRSISPDW